MAETIEYVVRIKGLSEDEQGEKQKSPLSSGIEGLQKMLNPTKTLLVHKSQEDVNTYFVKEITKNSLNTFNNIVQHDIQRYFKLSEDYKSEYYAGNIMGSINKIKGIGSSALAGAVAGAKFGPAGVIMGAAVGSSFSYMNQYINYQNQVANYEMALNATRVETAFRAQRAGLYNGGKGTEN